MKDLIVNLELGFLEWLTRIKFKRGIIFTCPFCDLALPFDTKHKVEHIERLKIIIRGAK